MLVMSKKVYTASPLQAEAEAILWGLSSLAIPTWRLFVWRVIQSYVSMLSNAKWKIFLGVFGVVVLLCCMFFSPILAGILIGLKEGLITPPTLLARWSLNNQF